MNKLIRILQFGLAASLFFAFSSSYVLAEEVQQTSTQEAVAPKSEEPQAAAPEAQAQPAVALTTEKMDSIRQAVEKLIKEEIAAVGSFEVDHPETGDLLSLSLEGVHQDVKQTDEGEYLVPTDFKDKAGAAYSVDIYVEELGNGEYELADAIVESIAGKPVAAE